MNELYIFKQEKLKYEEQIQFEENEYSKQKLTKEFQNKTKRYLGSAINIINTNFDISYSMNKEAMGLTSSFKKIKSIVRKTDDEILQEMKQLDDRISALSIDETAKETARLAIDIVRIYCTNGNQEAVDDKLLEVDVFKDNKKEEVEKTPEEIIIDDNLDKEELVNKEESIKPKINVKKDRPSILFKIILSLIIIPVVCSILLVVLLFITYAFSKTALYKDLISNENYSKYYYMVFNGLLVLLSGISASFISGLIKNRTNNKIAFTILPFSIILLIMTFSNDITSLVIKYMPLDKLPEYIKTFDYSYALITIYGFMLFFYLFAIFQKHTKTSIVELINILIIIYVGIMPAISYVLNVFEFDKFKNFVNPIYNYSYIELVSRAILTIGILSNIVYLFIKSRKVIKEESIINNK